MDGPGTAPAPDASTPAPPEAPAAAPAPAPPGRPASDARLRLMAKAAGFLMMFLGALFTAILASSAYSLPGLPEQMAAAPGGGLDVSFPGAEGAQVVLDYRAEAPDTLATLGPGGQARLNATHATFDVRVTHGGATWTRHAFVPKGVRAGLDLDEAAPAQQEKPVGVAVDEAALLFWGLTVVPVAVVAGGWFAFRLRGPRLALAGASILVLAGALMVAQLGISLMTIALLGTGVLAFVFVHRARFEFQPLRPTSSGR